MSFFENGLCLGDTILVMLFFFNIFLINYNNKNRTFYSRFVSLIVFINVLVLILYFSAMVYDIMVLDLLLDIRCSPIQWFADFFTNYVDLLSTTNCAPQPGVGEAAGQAVDQWTKRGERVNTAVEAGSNAINGLTVALQPYARAITAGSALGTMFTNAPFLKGLNGSLKVGVTVTAVGWAWLSGK